MADQAVERVARPDRKKQVISGLLTLIVLVVVFVGILPRLGDYSVAFESIKSMRFVDLLALGAFTIANIIIFVFPYMAALPKLRFRDGFVLRQTSFLISNGVPAGGAIGLGLQVAMLRSYGYSSGAATAGVIVTGASNMIATISLPAVAAIGLIVTGEINDEATRTALISLLIGTGSIALLTLVVVNKRFAQWVSTTADQFLAWLHRKARWIKQFSVKKEVLNFYEVTHVVFKQRWHLLASSNLLQQLAQFSVLFVALEILEPESITLFAALWAFAVARLGSFIPLTPAGLGTVDAILTAMLVQAGVSNDAALAATLLWRMATFFPQMILGVLTFIYWRATSDSQQR